MKKVTKLFINIKKKQDWLAQQKGWKLVDIKGISYIFEPCSSEYNYEYIYFDKNKQELIDIRNQIIDIDIEFVCYSSLRAVFRKDKLKGEIHVYVDNYKKYKMFMKKHSTHVALGTCDIGLGSTQLALASTMNHLFILSSALFYLSGFMFFLSASYFKKCSTECDDGTYAYRMKKEK